MPLRTLFLLLLAAAFALPACADDSPDEAAGGTGAAGTGGQGGSGGQGGTGGEQVQRDTSGYEGLLAWSTGNNNGVHLWDLANSEMVYSVDDLEFGELAGDPTISADRRTLAYTHAQPYMLVTFVPSVRLVDIESGEETGYLTDDLGENWVRLTMSPSLSADAKRVAVLESSAEQVGDEYENQTTWALEVWDREANQRIRITDGRSKVQHPRLDPSGEFVYFLSDHDVDTFDLYRAAVEEEPVLERLSLGAHPDIDRPLFLYDGPAISADGRWVAYAGKLQTSNQNGAFLLDTQSGEVRRLGGDTEGVTRVDISADGSMVSWTVMGVVEEAFFMQAWVAPREGLDNATLLSDRAMPMAPVAFSADGQQVAYVTQDHELVVARVDGTDVRIVSGREERNVVALFGMTLTF